MIFREWRGRADPARAEAYPAHFRAHVIPGLRHVPGVLGAHLWKRLVDGRIEYLVLSRWQSLDVIRAFAGDDVSHAVVDPGAIAALIDFDATVQHYEVLEEA
jgi:heme-degrading monooxygenase HmoA